jgi:hypothetical protein
LKLSVVRHDSCGISTAPRAANLPPIKRLSLRSGRSIVDFAYISFRRSIGQWRSCERKVRGIR